LLKSGLASSEFNNDAFRITDAHYGTTASLYHCNTCGFIFCPEMDEVLPYYEALQDPEYENTREARALQANKLLKIIRRYRASGRLLDVGAGSGIMVEQALKEGYDAEGIEPCAWLCAQAAKRKLPLHQGCLPNVAITGTYDVITLIDVIEHVSNPMDLLMQSMHHLAGDGVVVIVTPDVHSLAARLLRKRWWHYRVAHIGYFDRRTLQKALANVYLTPIVWLRPAWFFPLSYLLIRLRNYIPFIDRLARWSWTQRITIPLNLRDSLLVIARRTNASE